MHSSSDDLAWRQPAAATLASVVLAVLILTGIGRAQAPASPSAPSPRAWADAAAAQQLRILDTDDTAPPVGYRVHKIDAKGDTTREILESREGTVARLLARNQAPLTPEENSDERARLQDILDSPSTFLHRRERSHAARNYAAELLHSMPQAMLWSYAPGQPQLAGAHAPQIVLDFRPDPAFKPPTLVTEGLTAIAGRVWIDASAQCVTRIEGRILHPVDFGWGGVLARIGGGGTVSFEQAEVGAGRWLYTALSEHLTIREVLVHTVHEDTEMRVTEAHLLPSPLSYREAIQRLLALPAATR